MLFILTSANKHENNLNIF